MREEAHGRDRSLRDLVEVDASKPVARAQAGALVRDLDEATQRFGLATTSGGCPTVGIAGLTLGGGEGLSPLALKEPYTSSPRTLITAVIAIVADVIGEAHGSPVILPDAFRCAGGWT